MPSPAANPRINNPAPRMSDNFSELARAAKSAPVDAAGLAADLRRNVRGEVRFDDGTRALYATDGSNYRQVPIGVVLPRDADDVIATISLARKHGAPILCRGGGTSLAGQCCNVAVILDMSKYMATILDVDPAQRLARVQPGVILDHLRNAAEKHQLTFAPDPATHDRCTLGGMIGNNSCGVHSVMAGKTDDNIEHLDVLTYDGLRLRVGSTTDQELESIIRQGGRRAEIYTGLKTLRDQYSNLIRERYPNIPRRVSGYNLNYLLPENNFHIARALVGSEGTCVTVLEATCRLVESPPERVLLVIAYPDVFQCADHVPDITAHKPIGLEGIDDLLVKYTRRKGINTDGLELLPEGGGWLLAEFGAGTSREAEVQARKLMAELSRVPNPPQTRLFTDPQQAKKAWEIRESALGVTAHVPGEPLAWEGWEDSSVAPEKLGNYLRQLKKLMSAHGYHGTLYGHFGHACVHTRINFDLQSQPCISKYRQYDGGVMCPSFRVTREEEHSTRGRAHLLWEMTKGEIIRNGWHHYDVKHSLDLCLSCKGCKSECPVGVDVATYKAEFLSHYYQGRVRPRSAYAFAHIDVWARLASHFPAVANIATQLPLLRDIAKLVAGMPQQRRIPPFASQTLRTWFERRNLHKEASPNPDANPILLWPDTFNNYFHPVTAQAAVDVLE